ncbi:Sm-like ribonucleo protein [Sistotremastrum niveocremeum HHB9708]|uniref:Sm protein B n=1 Tax=Sistotremastrum niveocremeum HHB9708 TaxID=1314777 RepID=A0A164VRF3_9AGAM|nr:Sm-like ribonucleo protein [Sistotremastrum niveocremeum HHB9708]
MPPPKAKGGKMLSLINWRLKVTLNDGRALIGQMLAYDKHMNLVLAECEEFRRVRPKKKTGDTAEPRQEQEIKRSLGLVILRGEIVVSISVEGPPPVVEEDKKGALPPGPGRGMPAGRGVGMMPGPPRPPMPFGPPGMPGPPPPGFGGPPPGFPPGMPPMGGPPPGFGGPPPPGFPPRP